MGKMRTAIDMFFFIVKMGLGPKGVGVCVTNFTSENRMRNLVRINKVIKH